MELTNADCRQTPDGLIRRVALRKEWLRSISGKSQPNYGYRAGPNDQALGPQTDEAYEGPKGVQDVGVVPAGFLDHAAELGVAVGSNHWEEAADEPHGQGHVDGSSS